MGLLENERTVLEIEENIEALKKLAENGEIGIEKEIKKLEDTLRIMKEKAYKNLTPWEKVIIARHPKRPIAPDYINYIFTDFIEFHGDRYYADDASIVGGIGYLDNIPVYIIGQQKGKSTKENVIRNFGMPHPEGYRKALRLMKQAEKFNKPIICLIDTPGAYCGIGAEERGQGEAIARNLLEMFKIKTPIISVIIGEGGSGGALALGVADRVYMLEHSIYSILSPEGFASILWKDAGKAKEAAEIMKITAQELYEFGIIDGIISESQGAHNEFEKVATELKNKLIETIKELSSKSIKVLLEERYNKFRKFGVFKE